MIIQDYSWCKTENIKGNFTQITELSQVMDLFHFHHLQLKFKHEQQFSVKFKHEQYEQQFLVTMYKHEQQRDIDWQMQD